jgi:hypothetical protein
MRAVALLATASLAAACSNPTGPANMNAPSSTNGVTGVAHSSDGVTGGSSGSATPLINSGVTGGSSGNAIPFSNVSGVTGGSSG